jgi:hypothetical protein
MCFHAGLSTTERMMSSLLTCLVWPVNRRAISYKRHIRFNLGIRLKCRITLAGMLLLQSSHRLCVHLGHLSCVAYTRSSLVMYICIHMRDKGIYSRGI